MLNIFLVSLPYSIFPSALLHSLHWRFHHPFWIRTKLWFAAIICPSKRSHIVLPLFKWHQNTSWSIQFFELSCLTNHADDFVIWSFLHLVWKAIMFSTLLETENSIPHASAFFAAWKSKINICVYRSTSQVRLKGDKNVCSTIAFM